MPIYPGSAMSTVGPYGTSKCRPVRIRASGEATAYAATGSAALREARTEARRLRDQAVGRVRTIRCPKKGGCAAGCQQGRTMRIAWGTRLWPARPRDGDDLSQGAEESHAARIRALFADLGLWVDVKNEARVHLWYAEKFGNTLAPYVSTEDAITTFPTTATAVGVQPRANGLHVFSPYGLSDLLGLIVRPNKKKITRPIYEAKVKKWLARWPDLRVVAWDAGPDG